MHGNSWLKVIKNEIDPTRTCKQTDKCTTDNAIIKYYYKSVNDARCLPQQNENENDEFVTQCDISLHVLGAVVTRTTSKCQCDCL